MSMIKRYLENLVCACSDQAFGQEAVEHAILTGRVKLSYKLEEDVRMIMGPLPSVPFIPSVPSESERPPTLYDTLITEYQAVVQSNQEALWQSYTPILDFINATQVGRVTPSAPVEQEAA